MAFLCRNQVLPLARQGMVTLLFTTFSMMTSPGSAKDGASVKTRGGVLDQE